MLGDLAAFIKAVSRDWIARITSGVTVAIAAVYEHLANKMVSPKIVFVGLGVFLIVGAFQAFREQRQLVRSLTDEKFRPNFAIESSELKPGNYSFGIFVLENKGAHPATEISMTVVVQNLDLSGEPQLSGLSPGDEVVSGAQVSQVFPIRTLGGDLPPQCIACCVEYQDQVSGTNHRQVFFRTWGGVKNQMIAPPKFLPVSRDEKERLIAYYTTILKLAKA